MDVLYATFNYAEQAQRACGALLDHGLTTQDITVIGGNADAEKAVDSAATGISATSTADAAVGAGRGAGVGLGLGVLGSMAALFVPGFGFVTGGGALATALIGTAGATAAGAVAGGAAGYLVDLGMPEEVAANYEKALKGGGAIVAVSLPSGHITREAAEQILGKYGAQNVTFQAERKPAHKT